ncbi:MAG: aquaporin family protein [Solirubrobacterales bacterium]|nr:aquaporin family protein [Solirubrobacterales bacterium]
MRDRGLAAYIAELIGTMLLVFFICSVVVLFVAVGQNAQFGSDYAVVGLVQAFLFFGLIVSIGVASGGHFNPAITFGFAVLRRIDPMDAVVYILAQLSGGVLGALLCKAFLLDEGRASDYGAVQPSALIGGSLQAGLLEAIGAFVLVMVVLCVVLNPGARREWAPLAIGTTVGMLVMVIGPLDGGSFNPARWFGPALVGNNFADVWPYLAGPFVGAGLAAALYKFVIEPVSGPGQALADTIAPRGPAPPADEAPPFRQETMGGPASTGGPPKPPSSPPGGIVGG